MEILKELLLIDIVNNMSDNFEIIKEMDEETLIKNVDNFLTFWNIDESIWLRFGSIQECLQKTFGWGEYVYKYIFRIAVGLAGSFFIMSLIYHICHNCR